MCLRMLCISYYKALKVWRPTSAEQNSEHLYSASQRYLIKGAPTQLPATKKSFQMLGKGVCRVPNYLQPAGVVVTNQNLRTSSTVTPCERLLGSTSLLS